VRDQIYTPLEENEEERAEREQDERQIDFLIE